MKTDQFKPRTVYTTYIAASPDRVWEALTRPEFTTQYFFGRRIESDWKTGSAVKYWQPDGALDVQGKIMRCEPPRLLSFTWHVEWAKELRELPENLVTFQIDAPGEGIARLTVTESHLDIIEDKMLEGGRRGWPVILSSLKSLLETGRALPQFNMMADSPKAFEEMRKAAKKLVKKMQAARRTGKRRG